MLKKDTLKEWLARPRSSRDAVLTELRAQAELHTDSDDPESVEDADSLLAAIELLDGFLDWETAAEKLQEAGLHCQVRTREPGGISVTEINGGTEYETIEEGKLKGMGMFTSRLLYIFEHEGRYACRFGHREKHGTLAEVVEWLILESKRPEFHYAVPVMSGWVYAGDGMGRFYCWNCGRRYRDDPPKGHRCPKCGSKEARRIK